LVDHDETVILRKKGVVVDVLSSQLGKYSPEKERQEGGRLKRGKERSENAAEIGID